MSAPSYLSTGALFRVPGNLPAPRLRNPVRLRAAALFLIASFLGADAMADYESPRYTVTETVADNVELRSYEPMLLAEVTVTGDRGTASSRAFRILAGFIFGKNTSSEKIAMTAPVTQTEAAETTGESQKIAMTVPVTQTAESEGTWRVSFMMPSEFTEATLPVPEDERIRVYTTEPYRAVALRFSGRHSDSNFGKHVDELRDVVEAASLKTSGEPILAYYNAPFTLPFTRRNEVMFVLED